MAGPNVQISSTAGRSLDTQGRQVLAGAGDGCCCASGSNPCASAPSAIAILDYTDNYFSGCGTCMAAIAGDCVWDGTFGYFDAGLCEYSAAQCFNGGSFGANGFCFDCSFNHQRMWQFNPPGPPTVVYNATTGIFTLTITCQTGQDAGEIVWQGTKTGSTFAGVYTRTAGCDPRATVEIA